MYSLAPGTHVNPEPRRRAWCHRTADSDPAGPVLPTPHSNGHTRSNTPEIGVWPPGADPRARPRMVHSVARAAPSVICARGAAATSVLRRPACAGWRRRLLHRLALQPLVLQPP